jgi:hypothetical protein
MAVVVLLWPRSELPASGKIPIWLIALLLIAALCGLGIPTTNALSLTLTGPELPFIALGYGMWIWWIAAMAGLLAAALGTLRIKRRIRPPGTPMPRGLRVTLQVLVTIVLVIGFLLAAALPCGLEETDAGRRACFEDTTAWKVYLGIGIGGALVGLLATWIGPPLLRRRRAASRASSNSAAPGGREPD